MTQPLSLIDFGRTVSCAFDLAPIGTLISGAHVLSEALIRRLLTPRGRLLDDPDYGYEILQHINEDIGPADVGQIASDIDLEFSKDERVQSSSTTASFANGTLTVTSTIACAPGPFTLVVQVTPQAVPYLVYQILGQGPVIAPPVTPTNPGVPPLGSPSIVSAPFIPTLVPGCDLWLRGDLGITLNSGNVSSWADQSGAGNHFTQGTAGLQPPFLTSAINGLPGITGVASSNRLLQCVNAGTAMGITTAGTRFIVLQTSLPGGFQPYQQSWGAGSSLDYIHFSDGDTYDGFASSVRYNWLQTISGNTTYILQEISQAGSWQAYLNGTLVFTSGTNTVAMSASSPQLLFSQAASTELMTIAEVIMFANVPSAPNQAAVYNYLFGRYA